MPATAPTRPSSAERVYQVTKDEILSGRTAGGELLSEVEVAARLNVSRTPVHEAFLRLAAEDFLELLPRRGAVVVPVAQSDAADLLEMRLALETAAVRRLCRSAPGVDGLLTELAELLHLQRRSLADGDAAGFAEADDTFHRRIVTVAGNAIACRFYGSLSDRQRRMMAAAAQRDPRRLTSMVDEHDDLAAAIFRRDHEEFETVLLHHLQNTYRVVLG